MITIQNNPQFKEKIVIFLSPHYDDMIYSSSLTIRRLIKQHCQIVNVNFFTKSRWMASSIHKEVNVVSRIRFAEEQRAAKHIGFATISLDIKDSSARGLNAIQERKQKCDVAMLNNCYKKFYVRMKNFKYDYIWIPLAVGNHIDHKYVRIIGEKFSLTNKRIYYEDLPYINEPEHTLKYVPKNYKTLYSYGRFSDKYRDICFYPSQFEKKNIDIIYRFGSKLIGKGYLERMWQKH